KREINIACIVNQQHPPEACIGDWVLVHVGFAMNRINEKEAAETLKLLQEIAALH
ncbi:MAG: HypC/HybG/HupF family hydrogenase formation chaperone, partial [Dolichospermum sp.]